MERLVCGGNGECGPGSEATIRARAIDGCVRVQYETFRSLDHFEISSDTSIKLRSASETWNRSRVACFTS